MRRMSGFTAIAPHAAAKPVRAVLFTSLQSFIVPVIEALAGGGNEIAAVVATANSRRFLTKAEELAQIAPQWSWRKALARHAPGARVVFLRKETIWEDWAAEAPALHADLLISAHFMHRIPDAVLAAFSFGGVNLHPALLPEGAGVRPLHHMVAQGLHRERGGVTLHQMTAQFDAGQIIARARFSPEAFASENAYRAAVGGAMAALLRDRLPLWLHGSLSAKPQDMSRRAWAGELRGPLVIDASWPFERVALASRVLWRWPGFALDLGGERIPLHPTIRRAGPPTCAPPAISGRRIEFDVADARAASIREGAVAQKLARFGRTLDWIRLRPIPPLALE
jgi:methionyl-tRNA formyltransferase